MANFTQYLIQGAFWLGAASILWRQLRKDVTGVGNKTRELERKRIRGIAVLIELFADNPERVRRLAKHLHDDS